jgi:hypothetical protein
MSGLVLPSLYLWPLAVLAMFALMPPRRAVIFAFLFAWLFLPIAGIEIDRLPDYTKVSATSFGVIVGILIFDWARLMAFRPSWLDVPMVGWLAVAGLSVLVNGDGAYPAMSEFVQQTIGWGIPYFIGRLYLTDLEAVKDLALGIVIGGLLYAPLCLVEWRLSPQLHRWIYGYHQHAFDQAVRAGSYRPMVFMQHGLAVALWMWSATIVSLALWLSGGVKRVWLLPMGAVFGVLLVTSLLFLNSVGAMALGLLAIATYGVAMWRKSTWPVLVLTLLPLAYIGVRASGLYSGESAVALAASAFGENRAQSLGMRLEMEGYMIQHAAAQPLLGWGGADDDARPRHPESGRKVVTDGMWAIVVAKHGFSGLAMWLTLLMAPTVVICWKGGQGGWFRSKTPWAAAVSLMLVLAIFTLDSLLNAMINPIWLLASGGLASVAAVLIMPRASAAAALRQRGPRTPAAA